MKIDSCRYAAPGGSTIFAWIWWQWGGKWEWGFAIGRGLHWKGWNRVSSLLLRQGVYFAVVTPRTIKSKGHRLFLHTLSRAHGSCLSMSNLYFMCLLQRICPLTVLQNNTELLLLVILQTCKLTHKKAKAQIWTVFWAFRSPNTSIFTHTLLLASDKDIQFLGFLRCKTKYSQIRHVLN